MQRYFDIVAEELKSRHLRDGLWARALAETEGDNAKARAMYIKFRVEELQNESEATVRREAARVKRESEMQRAEELRRHHESEEREFAQRASEGPGLARVIFILAAGFAALVLFRAVASVLFSK